MSILLKNIHGNIGNILWRIAAGEYYRRSHDMDEMILLIRSDLDYQRYMSVFRWMGWDYRVIRSESEMKGVRFVQFRQQLKINTKYVPLPDVRKAENFWFSGANESPQFFGGDRMFAQHLFPAITDNGLLTDEVLGLYPEIDFDGIVSINVRRGDKMALQDKYVIPSAGWIRRAMDRFTGCMFLFTSDDISWCRREFGNDPRCLFADRITDNFPKWLIDLRLQTLCRHNIISNSTFSWWGAYLNCHTDRKVIYTLPWYRHRTPSQTDSIPLGDGWEVVQ